MLSLKKSTRSRKTAFSAEQSAIIVAI
jgi:hypothetical protein